MIANRIRDYLRSRLLRDHSRGFLDWLLRRSQCDQHNPDDCAGSASAETHVLFGRKSFPKGKFDDQCDSTSQALDWTKSAYSGTTNYTSYDNRDRLKTKATPEGTLKYT